MEQVQSFIDSVQESLNGMQSFLAQASEWAGTLFNGSVALGGILLALLGAAILAGAAFLVKHFIDN